MVINKIVELYREAYEIGPSVFLSIRHLNGQESFFSPPFRVQTCKAGQNAAVVPEEDVDRKDAKGESQPAATVRSYATAKSTPLSL